MQSPGGFARIEARRAKRRVPSFIKRSREANDLAKRDRSRVARKKNGRRAKRSFIKRSREARPFSRSEEKNGLAKRKNSLAKAIVLCVSD